MVSATCREHDRAPTLLAAEHFFGRVLPEGSEMRADAMLESINVGQLACHVIVRFLRIEIEVVQVSVGETLQNPSEAARGRLNR